jgi:hypothetical protein
MLALVLLAHSAADRVVISKTPLVEVVFSGHYPARLAKDPRLEQALAAAAYKHRKLEREDAGGEVSDVFDAMDGAQHFRIQYEPRRSGWTLGAVVGGRLEPLLHTRSSQRHSPVATQWFVPADGGGNAAEVATLGDVRCEYVSDAAKHAADELQRAADEADAAAATKAAEGLRAAQEQKAAEEARRVEEQHEQHAMKEVEAQQPAREAPSLSGRPSGRREVPSSAARNKSNTDFVVTGLIGFVALLFLLLVLGLWVFNVNMPGDLPSQGAVVTGQSRRGVFDRDRRVYTSGVRLLELLDW